MKCGALQFFLYSLWDPFFLFGFLFRWSDKVCLTNRLLKNAAVDSSLYYFYAKAVTIKFESNLT